MNAYTKSRAEQNDSKQKTYKQIVYNLLAWNVEYASAIIAFQMHNIEISVPDIRISMVRHLQHFLLTFYSVLFGGLVVCACLCVCTINNILMLGICTKTNWIINNIILFYYLNFVCVIFICLYDILVSASYSVHCNIYCTYGLHFPPAKHTHNVEML